MGSLLLAPFSSIRSPVSVNVALNLMMHLNYHAPAMEELISTLVAKLGWRSDCIEAAQVRSMVVPISILRQIRSLLPS
jgi:hypothetical protein